MATYNKRGYKVPKAKEDKVDGDFIEDVNVDVSDSTTAEVFNSLDETASKTEDFIARNQKIILGVVGVVAIAAIGYLLYTKFVVEPKEVDAADQMFLAQKNFQLATDGTSSDSLYTLALNGSEGKWGFVKIADEFSGTNAGNLANYYAGMAYLHTGKYDNAISYLEKFSSDDAILKANAIGGIGDAHSQKGNQKEALDFYKKAAESNKNDFTTPRFLLKAGKTALALGNKEEALKYFTDIKDNYETAQEAQGIDALIGLSQ
ncbi:tetratricopeptide (TPR) repeat protein [Flavobacterium arsenatis]|uniref:Tetratricopeptide (TPR) repeat protein n=1 Tax=Flavobacterium arsenatis TaxID=1484332 RepID=A0ABU1TSK4_9FLAO|nr:tetratricopeptide repeat protein [Flavobacterium arsenatis]MDR6968868.1 tetratricopeptide (TPR) repeat protein [Flavobacterium arsenatis]